MSSYLNFYVRKANTEICISLVSYSRSNKIYETFEEVFGSHIEDWNNPKCQSLTMNDLNEWADYIKGGIKHSENSIKYYKDLQQYVKTIPAASLDEIMEHYNEYQEMIDYNEKELKELTQINYLIYFLKHINEEQQLLEKNFPNTPWIYAGIEGSNPYPDDHKETK